MVSKDGFLEFFSEQMDQPEFNHQEHSAESFYQQEMDANEGQDDASQEIDIELLELQQTMEDNKSMNHSRALQTYKFLLGKNLFFEPI